MLAAVDDTSGPEIDLDSKDTVAEHTHTLYHSIENLSKDQLGEHFSFLACKWIPIKGTIQG